MATSCDPPDAECPVRPSGTSVSNEPANNTGVGDHRNTSRADTATTAAISAVQRHAEAASTRGATSHNSTGFRCSRTGSPETSEIVNGTISTAHNAAMPDAAAASRSAR